jgi:TRAP-type mannitol/chloroaromatic compound transport system substrate-binding protein
MTRTPPKSPDPEPAHRPASPARRRFLRFGAAGLTAGVAIPSLARADAPVVWKMATAWGKGERGGGEAAARLAAHVAALSAGRLMLQVFGVDELAPADGVFDAVASATAEAGFGVPAAGTVRDPAFHFFAGVPFGLSPHEHAAWLSFGGGDGLWHRAYDPFGVVPFFAGSTGVPDAGWFRNQIAMPTDVKDVPIAAAGLSGEIWRRLGAVLVDVPPGGMVAAYTAQKIDAAEASGLWLDIAAGLAGLTARCYAPGFRTGGPALEFIVNAEAFAALPDDLKAVVRAAATATAHETTAEFVYNNAGAMADLGESGTPVAPLPEPIVRAAGREAAALLEELADGSPIAQEVHDSFVMFRRKAVAYAPAGDEGALRLRAIGLSEG